MGKKIFSFFAGCGFLDLGFEKAGFDVVYVNEINPSFIEAYKFSRETLNVEKPKYGYSCSSVEEYCNSSLREVALKKYIKECKESGDTVGFIGGPPCPDFSIGGKQKGLEGENGKLTQTYASLIIKQKPDWFLFENVKGLFQTKKHREFFDEIFQSIKDEGYQIKTQMLNAMEFGVPQFRERVIVFGIRTNGKNNSTQNGEDIIDFRNYTSYSVEEIAKAKWPKTRKYKTSSTVSCPEDILSKLSVEYWFNKNDVYKHFNASHHFNPLPGNDRFKTIKEGFVAKKSYKRLHRWRFSPTAAYGNNEVHLHPYKPRRISAAEALAIQSMPKNFILPKDMTLTNMFKTIGNGVPYLMAKGLAKAVDSRLELQSKNKRDTKFEKAITNG